MLISRPRVCQSRPSSERTVSAASIATMATIAHSRARDPVTESEAGLFT